MIERYSGCRKLIFGFLIVEPIIYTNRGRRRRYNLRYAVFVRYRYHGRIISFLPFSMHQNAGNRASILVKNFDSPEIFSETNGQARDYIVKRRSIGKPTKRFYISSDNLFLKCIIRNSRVWEIQSLASIVLEHRLLDKLGSRLQRIVSHLNSGIIIGISIFRDDMYPPFFSGGRLSVEHGLSLLYDSRYTGRLSDK